MPRQTGTVTENNFIKGLITETTGLRFPTDACTETWSCVFDETGRVTRRLGMDIESDISTESRTVTNQEATSSYLWSYIGSYTDGAFLVQQIGTTISFYDVTASPEITGNKKAFSINLVDYQSRQSISPISYPCQYAQGSGRLIIVNQSCTPILVNYSFKDDNITVTEISIKYRDFEGLDDGLDVDFRPVSTAADLVINNPAHIYNLLNQGWYAGETGVTQALNQWDVERTDLPSNADAPVYYRAVNEQDVFDPLLVAGTDPGNSPAPKGHFILELGLQSRAIKAGEEGWDLDLNEESTSNITYVDQSIGTTIGNITTPANAFDGNESTLTDSFTTNAYLGKDYGASPFIPATAKFYFISTGGFGGGQTVTYSLYGSNTLPTSSTDGTLLRTSSFVVPSSPFNLPYRRTIAASTFTTPYRYIWLRLDGSKGGRLVELQFSSYDENAISDKSLGPRAVAFFASRAFYAGIEDADLGANIYFSQLIETDSQFSKCYQVNDPTSIEIADLLATDGGVIKIPDIGNVYRLFAFQNQLLVLAANGVWSISGPNDGPFSATGYVVKRLSSIGMSSPYSVVDVKGLPVWWGEDGIYTVQYDANYGSTVVKSLTEESIKQFILDIPEPNRKNIKGAYDKLNDIAYWLYTDENVGVVGKYKFNNILCFNAKTLAFYPWDISRSTTTPQYLKDIIFVQDGLRSTVPAIKFLTYSDSSKLFYSETKGTDYYDWTLYSSLVSGIPADKTDYMSYFISGYRVDGDGMLYIQAPYVFWYLEPESFSYINTRALFDWTKQVDANKWSTPQTIECRPIGYTQFKELKVYRRKYRGKGRAMQLKVESDTGKPFTLLGWGILASSSTTV